MSKLMKRMGKHIKLWHITDQGYQKSGPYNTPILKEDSMELGYRNMDLETLSKIALENDVEGVVLEKHKNWANGDPIQSIQLNSQL